MQAFHSDSSGDEDSSDEEEDEHSTTLKALYLNSIANYSRVENNMSTINKRPIISGLRERDQAYLLNGGDKVSLIMLFIVAFCFSF